VAPCVQCRKVWLTPTTRVSCSNAANTRNQFKFAGMLQTRQQISDVVGRSSPYCEDTWGEILLFNKFFSDCRYTP